MGSDLDETSDVEDPEKKAKDDLEGYKQERQKRRPSSRWQLSKRHVGPSRTGSSVRILRELVWSGRTFVGKCYALRRVLSYGSTHREDGVGG